MVCDLQAVLVHEHVEVVNVCQVLVHVIHKVFLLLAGMADEDVQVALHRGHLFQALISAPGSSKDMFTHLKVRNTGVLRAITASLHCADDGLARVT